MEFDHFLSLISKLNRSERNGVRSHLKMIPKERQMPNLDEIQNKEIKRAAVLALFYPGNKNETLFLLTLRANYHGTHAAQISFPGGKFEESDQSLKKTALRETYEEVGVSMDQVIIKTKLTDTYIPPSNFLVRPYLGFTTRKPEFITNHEVEQVIEVKLTDLLDDSMVTTKNLTTSYMKNIDVPCFRFNNQTVWGATAMMLSEIKDLIKENLH